MSAVTLGAVAMVGSKPIPKTTSWGVAGRLALAASLLTVGCGLGDPTAPGLELNDDGLSADVTGESGLVASLMLDPITNNSTCAEEIAVTGTTEGGLTVFATAPGGNVTTIADSTGRFCLAVQLEPGANNIGVSVMDLQHGPTSPQYQLVTRATTGCAVTLASGTTSASDTQQGSGTDSSGATTSSTIASSGGALPADAAIAAVASITVGAPVGLERATGRDDDRALIDGDPTTYVDYLAGSSGFFGSMWNAAISERANEMWITLTLDQPETIREVVIRWVDSQGNGTRYAGRYYLAVAAGNSPGALPVPVDTALPPPSDGSWQYLIPEGRRLSEDGGVDIIDLSSVEPTARHVGLWLVGDGTSSVISAQEFAVAEVEVRVPKATASGYTGNATVTGVPPAGFGGSGVCATASY